MPERALKCNIATRVRELKTKARERYSVVIDPKIRYNVTGTTAGYAEFDSHILDFHLGLAVDNKDVFVEEIVGHEFCHLVSDVVYSHRGHGVEWKEVMREFDLKPDRYHKLDVSRYARKPRSYPYACTCNTYNFNRPTHYKLQSGLFECNHCRGLVKFKGAEKDVRRFKAGTREHKLMTTLAEYKKLGIPMSDQLILLMDLFKVSFATARSYYYEYRPAA